MRLDELHYDLPPECIATQPADPRDSARLMVVNRGGDLAQARGEIEHLTVGQLAREGILSAGDLLVFNQTRVLPAQFDAIRAVTGGKVSGLYLEATTDDDWYVLLEARGTLSVGEMLSLNDPHGSHLELIDHQKAGQWRVRRHSDLSGPALLIAIGRPPLPPYIRRARKARGENKLRAIDSERYNTVFACEPGSVAAPTAALHFTHELLAAIDRLGVQRVSLTLHIGWGTFAPVRTPDLADHAMQREYICVPQTTIEALRKTRDRGGRVIPVGTTCVRALECLPDPLPTFDFMAHTELFIRPAAPGEPSFPFRFTDALMTNFHLPRSTLLALVAALPQVGVDRLKQWYRIAIQHGYRFYSYGDAMLLI